MEVIEYLRGYLKASIKNCESIINTYRTTLPKVTDKEVIDHLKNEMVLLEGEIRAYQNVLEQVEK